jgi:hypothetical protein
VFGEMSKDLKVLKMLDMPKVQISRSGHFMMIDNPEEFYQKLLRSLAHYPPTDKETSRREPG